MYFWYAKFVRVLYAKFVRYIARNVRGPQLVHIGNKINVYNIYIMAL